MFSYGPIRIKKNLSKQTEENAWEVQQIPPAAKKVIFLDELLAFDSIYIM